MKYFCNYLISRSNLAFCSGRQVSGKVVRHSRDGRKIKDVTSSKRQKKIPNKNGFDG